MENRDVTGNDDKMDRRVEDNQSEDNLIEEVIEEEKKEVEEPEIELEKVSLEGLKNGAQIAVPNDATNEARAVLLLESAGLIKLKDNTDISTTLKDITENPKNLDIVELEASQIPRSLEDVDIAVVNGNYAVEAGFNAKEDALAFEEQDSPSGKSYVNVIAVKNGNEDNEGVQALIKALQTDKVKKYIEENYQGAVLPML